MACFFRVFFVFVFNHNLRKQMVLLFSLFSLTICWRVGSEDCKDSASTMHAGVALDPVWVVWCWNVYRWLRLAEGDFICLLFFSLVNPLFGEPLYLYIYFLNHPKQLSGGLWKEEQNFLHSVVLPTGGNSGCRTVQHCDSSIVCMVYVLFFNFCIFDKGSCQGYLWFWLHKTGFSFVALQQRCCVCIRCSNTQTSPSCMTTKRSMTFAEGTWTLNAQPTPIWTGWSPRSFQVWLRPFATWKAVCYFHLFSSFHVFGRKTTCLTHFDEPSRTDRFRWCAQCGHYRVSWIF